MNVPSPPQFRASDFTELPAMLLGLLTRSFRSVYEILARIPEEQEAVGRFVTASAAGLATLELKNLLAQAPNHVSVTLVRNDAAPATPVAYASTWQMAGELIRVSFSGLTASTKFRIHVRYR